MIRIGGFRFEVCVIETLILGRGRTVTGTLIPPLKLFISVYTYEPRKQLITCYTGTNAILVAIDYDCKGETKVEVTGPQYCSSRLIRYGILPMDD